MFSRALNPLKHIWKLNVRNSSTSTSASGYTTGTVQYGIANITMCHDRSRNALSIPMMEELIRKIKMFESSPSTRVIVIGAEGDVFSAGHSLRELSAEHGREQQNKVFELATQLMHQIIDSSVPIIAKVDGMAVAAGCQLVAQCDLAFCTEQSTFSTPGVIHGVFCSTPGVALARSIPKKTAMKMLLTGSRITAQEAEAKGLVTKVSTNLDEDVKEVCTSITRKSRAVIELGRRFYYKQMEAGVKDAYNMGAQVMVDNLNMEDCKQGIRRFLDKEWKFC